MYLWAYWVCTTKHWPVFAWGTSFPWMYSPSSLSVLITHNQTLACFLLEEPVFHECIHLWAYWVRTTNHWPVFTWGTSFPWMYSSLSVLSTHNQPLTCFYLRNQFSINVFISERIKYAQPITDLFLLEEPVFHECIHLWAYWLRTTKHWPVFA